MQEVWQRHPAQPLLQASVTSARVSVQGCRSRPPGNGKLLLLPPPSLSEPGHEDAGAHSGRVSCYSEGGEKNAPSGLPLPPVPGENNFHSVHSSDPLTQSTHHAHDWHFPEASGFM